MSHTQQHETKDKQQELPFESAPVKSWGDKAKGKITSMFAHIGVNYFVNATMSVAITYAFNSVFGKWFDKQTSSWAKNLTEKAEQKGGLLNKIDVKYWAKQATEFGTRSQLLLMGGHILVPLMKGMEENRKRIEFNFGKWIDRTQEIFGFGNEASRRNLTEYKQVEQSMKDGTHNVSKAVLDKHGVDDDMRFKTKRQPWSVYLKARALSVLFTATMSQILSYSDKYKRDHPDSKMVHYGQYEDVATPKVQSVIEKIPGFTKVFKDTQTWAKYYANDLVYTAISFVTFKTFGDMFTRRNDAKEAALSGEADLHGAKKHHAPEEHSAKHQDRRHHEDKGGGHRERLDKNRAAEQSYTGAAL